MCCSMRILTCLCATVMCYMAGIPANRRDITFKLVSDPTTEVGKLFGQPKYKTIQSSKGRIFNSVSDPFPLLFCILYTCLNVEILPHGIDLNETN